MTRISPNPLSERSLAQASAREFEPFIGKGRDGRSARCRLRPAPPRPGPATIVRLQAPWGRGPGSMKRLVVHRELPSWCRARGVVGAAGPFSSITALILRRSVALLKRFSAEMTYALRETVLPRCAGSNRERRAKGTARGVATSVASEARTAAAIPRGVGRARTPR